MVKTDEIKNNILKKFFFNEKLKYNELWDKSICSSSNFDYHLKLLIQSDILKKEGEFYILTNEGIKCVTSIDSTSMVDKKKPVPCAFILVFDKDNNKILFNIRKKQPYMEVLNIPGGKIELGSFSDEEARRELKEETGLECDIELKSITEKITYNIDKGIDKKEVEHHIIGYFYLGINYTGKLLDKTYEGENIWIKPEELSNFKRFPDLDVLVPQILTGDKIKIMKIERFRKDNEFVDLKVQEIN